MYQEIDGSKEIPQNLPPNSFHVFRADIALRKRRLESLVDELTIQPFSSQTITYRQLEGFINAARSELDQLQEGRVITERVRKLEEAMIHAGWLHHYGEAFDALTDGNSLAGLLCRFCPAAWKSLELACASIDFETST